MIKLLKDLSNTALVKSGDYLIYEDRPKQERLVYYFDDDLSFLKEVRCVEAFAEYVKALIVCFNFGDKIQYTLVRWDSPLRISTIRNVKINMS